MQHQLPSGKIVQIETSWDDGCRQDLRLHQLLLEYRLPGTFYIPTSTRELTDGQVKHIAETHEIGGHSETHQILRLMPPVAAEEEIKGCKDELEWIIGKPITTFCPPKGKYNQSIIDMVKAAGFTEMRTVDVLSTHVGDDPFRKCTSIHVFRRREYGGEHWLDVARKLFDRVMDPNSDDNYFHLWGHGWEIDMTNEWFTLETFLREMDTKIRLNP